MKYIKARAIEWAAVAAIVAIITVAVMIYQTRYKDYNVKTGDTMICDFKSSVSQTASGTMQPSKGKLYYGWCQEKGNSKCKYQLSYKKTSANVYKVLADGKSFKKNNVYEGDYKICKTNGKKAYNIICKKTAGKKVHSKLRIDWMIE